LLVEGSRPLQPLLHKLEIMKRLLKTIVVMKLRLMMTIRGLVRLRFLLEEGSRPLQPQLLKLATRKRLRKTRVVMKLRLMTPLHKLEATKSLRKTLAVGR
jgi:hypothetical protein